MKNSQRKIRNSRNALNLSRKSSARSVKLPDRADLLSLHLPLECSLASRQQFHPTPTVLNGRSGDAPAPQCMPPGMHSTSFANLHSLFRDLREGISCFFAISIPAFREARNAIGVFLKNAFSFLVQIRMQKEDSSSFHSLYPKIREWLLQNPAVSIPACQKLRNGF